ncbi:hypothetical protein NFI96_023993 [Prochilodus magdalenae]|nr:hypothetical protein NFI96_023993 [Prochilodus magdalenae]
MLPVVPDNISTCWYILLSGSVFVKEHMYLARCCFGRQRGGRRGCECITLEPSEMIVDQQQLFSVDVGLFENFPFPVPNAPWFIVAFPGELSFISTKAGAAEAVVSMKQALESGRRSAEEIREADTVTDRIAQFMALDDRPLSAVEDQRVHRLTEPPVSPPSPLQALCSAVASDLHRLSVIWKSWMFNQELQNLADSGTLQVENASDGEDAALQRDGSQRHSRRRFHRVNPRGERELITDGQDPASSPTLVEAFEPLEAGCFSDSSEQSRVTKRHAIVMVTKECGADTAERQGFVQIESIRQSVVSPYDFVFTLILDGLGNGKSALGCEECLMCPDQECLCLMCPDQECLMCPDQECLCLMCPDQECLCLMCPDQECLMCPDQECLMCPDQECLMCPDQECLMCPDQECFFHERECLMCPDQECLMCPDQECLMCPDQECLMCPDQECLCLMCPDQECLMCPVQVDLCLMCPDQFVLSQQLPGDLSKMHLTDHPHQQVMHMAPSQSGCSIASDSGSSSLSDIYQATESEMGDVDLSGLPEAPVDSEDEEEEDEDIERASDPLLGRDLVRECLEKEPADRNDDDIEQLLEFMHQLPAFANMTMLVRRELCTVMVFEVVEQAGTVILQDKQEAINRFTLYHRELSVTLHELDQWYVILNGAVEMSHGDGRTEILCMGNSFGISASLDKQYMNGEVRTKGDDCQCNVLLYYKFTRLPHVVVDQFVCIAQEDYWRILNHVEKNTHKVEEEGEIVMVKEHRELDRSGTRKGHIVIKGTPERLIMHLVEEPSVVDPTYIEDFLLTYRTFLSSPMEVGKKLLEWFNVDNLRDTVTRIVLLWVNNHFNDFEGNPSMTQFLEEFERLLDETKMKGHLRLLNIACAAKAKWRQVTLQKPSRESPLHFSLQGGTERGFGIFVETVEQGSKAAEAGLKRGDQIMEINGQNFENISYSKAMDILKNNTHLSLTVKTNIFVFKELQSRIKHEKKNGGLHIPKIQEKKGNRFSIAELPGDLEFPSDSKSHKKMKANTVSGGRNKIRKMLEKTRFSILPPKPFSDGGVGQSQDDSIVGTKQCRHSVAIMPIPGSLSSSSPDLLQPATSVLDFSNPSDIPDQVIRVFKADQQSCYIIISKDTTAKDVVSHVVNEFGLIAAPETYSLCEVSISPEGVIKQRRLPDQLSKLADRIQLNGRYYLKNNMETETLCSDDDAQELLRESQISLLQLSTVEVAAQLSMRDFGIFRNIESTEYVDDLFKLDPGGGGGGHLKQFEELINQETFWVAAEILREANTLKRMKTIKHFIKIALHCRECKNFNSMFAIISVKMFSVLIVCMVFFRSGLNLSPVSRLRGTWEKLPSKYEKLFRDLQDIFDPSRNMAKYRNILSSQSVQPPIIPLFPVVKKDLTFLHEGNDSVVDSLVNFEKLRMIAKEIRNVVRMTSANMDPALMFRQRSLSQGSTNSNLLDVQGGHKKRVRRSSLLNAKKLYEDAQMARKVKQYLAHLQVETDEEKFQIMSLQCEPAYSTLSKNLSERRSTKSDMSPVSMRSTPSSAKSQNRVSQVLQVPPVSLYPLRKKSIAKDLAAAHNSGSPQVAKKTSISAEECSGRRTEDITSAVSSLHSSPTVSPQGSPRKVSTAKSQDCGQMNLSGSSSSLTSEASARAGGSSTMGGGGRSYGIAGYALMPSGRSDQSDSSHSEISSRSSIVSNCSVDSMPAGPSEERCGGKASGQPETSVPSHPALDHCQPCTSSSLVRHSVTRGSTFTSSTSTEELTPDHTSVSEAADSGRGSWTSCSSNSHDNFQSLQAQRALDLMNHRHPPMGGPIAEVEAGPAWSEDRLAGRRHSGDSSDLNHSRQSWTSSSSLSDTYEGSYGTIKRKAAEHSGQGETANGQQSTDPAYKTVTSSTEKGLIVYCVTSPCKDDRYRAPPPTPPGYQGLALGDEGGALRPPHLKPPDYSVALQRSKLLQSPGALADPRRLVAGQRGSLARPPSVILQALADSEEEHYVVLIAADRSSVKRAEPRHGRRTLSALPGDKDKPLVGLMRMDVLIRGFVAKEINDIPDNTAGTWKTAVLKLKEQKQEEQDEHCQSPTAVNVSDQTIRNRPHEGGLRAPRPVVGPVLTGQHRRARLAFATEHQNWQIRHRRLVLFTDESRVYLRTCDRRDGIWRRRGECYAACNITQHDWFGGASVMVWGGISLEGRTDLYRLDTDTLTAIGYQDEILGPLVRPYVQWVLVPPGAQQCPASCGENQTLVVKESDGLGKEAVAQSGCEGPDASIRTESVKGNSKSLTQDPIAPLGSLVIHYPLQHLDSTNSYVRMLFIDFSSAFNTVIPSRLIHKLSTLGTSNTLCSWIMDFLTCTPHCVRIGEHTSPSLTLSTGCPQGIVLSPLLYTLYTHDCIITHSSNIIIEFTNDTTIIGNVTNDDEGPYREEVKLLTEWCAANTSPLMSAKPKS